MNLRLNDEQILINYIELFKSLTDKEQERLLYIIIGLKLAREVNNENWFIRYWWSCSRIKKV